MPSVKKQELKESYLFLLKEKPDIALTTYRGLSVDQVTHLRNQLRENGAVLRIVKNKIFKRAVGEYFDSTGEILGKNLQDPIGVVFSKGQLPGAARIVRDYGKENESVQLICGIMDASYCSRETIQDVAGLPSRDEIMSNIVASFASPATKIALSLSQIISSLARGIQAVAEKNHSSSG